jgi:hypothetical protein
MAARHSKKVESTNLRSHGICEVGRLPKDSVGLGNRFPGTQRLTSARGSLTRQFSVSMRPGITFQVYQPGAAQVTGLVMFG